MSLLDQLAQLESSQAVPDPFPFIISGTSLTTTELRADPLRIVTQDSTIDDILKPKFIQRNLLIEQKRDYGALIQFSNTHKTPTRLRLKRNLKTGRVDFGDFIEVYES